ncbi:MAG: hypothetical protein HOV81_14135 [Kofleriaceae bacterium]|nr:hypothetical protein [Kofleriaceae bacterium]
MNVTSSTWQLRSPCPCCGQGGLTFSTCIRCHRVLLVCAEVGTVFDSRDRCPCGSEHFENATSDQITALGFTPDDYA